MNPKHLKAILSGSMLLPAVTALAQSPGHPNIIMFLVDDMGWQDTSVPFWDDTTALNRRFCTPNMQRLADMGVRFTQAYSCAISSPTRCSLMSGMNASRHKVTNWTLELDVATDQTSPVIDLPDWHWNGIQPESSAGKIPNSTPITPLPQILRDNGYITIHCGKAHFGARSTPGADPAQMGFDINIGGGPNGAPGSYLGTRNFGEGSPFAVEGLDKYHGQDIFLTEALTIEAIASMKAAVAQGKPFYLYMSHYAVHGPYDEDVRFSGKYRGRPDSLLGAPLSENEARYAALVEGMDKSLGDILDYIQSDPDLAANTVILFMSDNGGQALNNVRQGRENRDQNYPARSGKGSAFMGGVREPMIVWWPGVTKPGTVCGHRVIIEDFYPSILEIAGARGYETLQEIDGRSFAGVLRGRRADGSRAIVWHFPNLWGESQDTDEGYGAYSAILKGDYHLIYDWEHRTCRLYNVREDIGEQHDLAPSMPAKVRSLASELSDYLRERGAQRPCWKADGKPIPYPDGRE